MQNNQEYGGMMDWTQEEMQIERNNFRILFDIQQREIETLKKQIEYYTKRREKFGLVDMGGE